MNLRRLTRTHDYTAPSNLTRQDIWRQVAHVLRNFELEVHWREGNKLVIIVDDRHIRYFGWRY
jgi:hypothetical protein